MQVRIYMSEFSDINNARIALLGRKHAVGLTHSEEQLLERLTETVDRMAAVLFPLPKLDEDLVRLIENLPTHQT